MPKKITLADYEEHGPEFFEKFNYVKKQLGKDSKAEDVLSVMKSLGAIVMKNRADAKASSSFGFNKVDDEDKDS